MKKVPLMESNLDRELRRSLDTTPLWATVCRVLAMLAVTWLGMVVMCPIDHVRENARKISCASNMKQIGTALREYAQDNDENLPPYAQTVQGQGQSWRETLFPYIKSRGVYQCPDGPRQASSDKPNPPLSDDYAASYIGTCHRDQGRGLFTAPGAIPISLAKVAHPESVIAVVEQRGNAGPEWNIASSAFLPTSGRSLYDHVSDHHGWFQAPPKIGSNMLFADGHIKSMKPSNTMDPANLWTRDNAPFTGQDLANAQAILNHAQEE